LKQPIGASQITCTSGMTHIVQIAAQ